MSRRVRILYCGDGQPEGSARYLLGILKHLKADVLHIPPGKKISQQNLKKSYHAVIFSDYAYPHLSRPIEDALIHQIKNGTGLLMIGGWASFSGPFGKWHLSDLQDLLPVQCRGRDDRTQFPSGAWMLPSVPESPLLRGISFQNPPVICGVNELKIKKHAETVLVARRILRVGEEAVLEKQCYPLLALQESPCRSASLATDLAPHWCGGLVDWGGPIKKISVAPNIEIQVGPLYIEFVSRLIRWTAGL